MARKLSSEQITELQFHYNRFLIYYKYMMECYFEPAYHQSDIEGTKMMLEIVERSYQNKKLKDLRSMTKEVNAMMREELGSRAIEVKRLFHEQLGEDIEAEEQKYQKKLNAIIKRGKVRTEAEYRFIDNRHQELLPEQGNTKDVLELDRLLGTFNVS